jgi:hypothetical protein
MKRSLLSSFCGGILVIYDYFQSKIQPKLQTYLCRKRIYMEKYFSHWSKLHKFGNKEVQYSTSLKRRSNRST